MYLRKFLFLLVLIISVVVAPKVYAQEKDKSEIDLAKLAKRGAVLKFNEQGSSYLKFGMGVQLWYRYMEMNPNTVDKNTQHPIDYYSDFALRRMRMSVMLNFENRHIIYSQFGLTSEASYNGLHSGIFFHDLWYKTRVAKNTYIGGGLHMWNGLSRLSNVTYASQITLDNPGINFPNVNVSDDFVRQYGIFLQGQFKKFDYSFSVNQPLLSTNSSKVLNDAEIVAKDDLGTAYNRYHNNFSYKGYLSYSVFNKEGVSKTPFKAMTYYGKKGRFLNVGAGFQYVDEASGILRQDTDIDQTITVEQHKQLSLSADLWFEQPLANESVLNIYAAYYNYDYGDNYLKSSAVMGGFAASNPDGVSPAQGSGINQFYIGTGDAMYFSIAYVIPKNIYDSNRKIMPFYAVTRKNFEGLNEASIQQDFGVQYLILGNNVKLSAQYSTRPVFDSSSLLVSENKGMFVLQLHAKF